MKLDLISLIRSKISLKFSCSVIFSIMLILLISSYFEINTYMKDSDSDLNLKIDTISGTAAKGLSHNLWTYNEMAIKTASEGLLQDKEIAGMEVTGKDSRVLCSYANEGGEYDSKYLQHKVVPIQYKDSFIGQVHISFTNYFRQMQIQKYLMIQLTKICGLAVFLIFIIYFISHRITKPLQELSIGTDRLASGNLQERVTVTSSDEVGKLALKFNNMAMQLEKAYKDLEKAYNDLENDALELEEKNDEIQHYSEKLEDLVKERTEDYNRANSDLIKKNEELSNTIRVLNETQNQLVQSEKMAALGNIVAGVAHEINTPLGVGITGISFLGSINNEFRRKLAEGNLTKEELKKFVEDVDESVNMTSINLGRAADLIKNFKRLAVDQSNDINIKFNLKDSIDAVLISLKHEYKKTNHKLNNNCPDSIELNSYPGDFSQIFTNLVMNSLKHGLADKDNGNINIAASLDDRLLRIVYTDDGVGIPEKNINRIFDPFFTTNRKGGGSGLGLNIIYNLVTQKLKGNIYCESDFGNGVKFVIEVPTENVV